MSEALWSLERKCFETVMGLELFVCLFVCLSIGLQCSLKRSSRCFVSPMYCLWQRLQCTMEITFLELQSI